MFGLNPFDTVREALRYAKELAGIPRSQQPVRQWIVTGDVTKYKNSNYVVSFNKGAQGRYYEFINAEGQRRIVALHTNDPYRTTHAHAGKPKPGSDPRTYDFKSPENKYAAIDDIKNKKDHHIDINCKG